MHITLLGTGLLGAAVSERLLAQGHTLSVWNRNPAKTTPLHEQGAQCAATAAAALQASGITLLFLADRAAIESVLLNESTRGALCGRLIVNMGTISPADSLALGQALRAAGADYAECPVLGSQPEARSGTLILMFGGTEAQHVGRNSAAYCAVWGSLRSAPCGGLRCAYPPYILTAIKLSNFIGSRHLFVESAYAP